MDTDKIQHFPALTRQIRTGPVQFGEDWPGVFIRGDDALMGLSTKCRYIRDNPEDNRSRVHFMNYLLCLFNSCLIVNWEDRFSHKNVIDNSGKTPGSA